MVDIRGLLNLAAVPRCLYCQAESARGVCDGCRDDLPWNRSACAGCAMPLTYSGRCRHCLRRPRQFDAAWTAFVLAPPVQRGLWELKYHARFEQARGLGRLMALELKRRPAPLPELLLPVPLHWQRLARRGYNQALEVSRVIGADLGIAVDARTLSRLRATTDQIGQSAAQRRRNMRGAFAATREALKGKHVALIDDVMTTGATLDALARACKREGGAAHVEAWAVARTP